MNVSVHKDNTHNPDTVTPDDLLKIGLDPAVLWNVDRDKKIKSHIFITATLINGYSENVISKLAEYFGKDEIIDITEQTPTPAVPPLPFQASPSPSSPPTTAQTPAGHQWYCCAPSKPSRA